MSDTKTLPKGAVLTYNLDEEYQIRIEEPEEFHQSYFRDVYHQAAKAVTSIINQDVDPNGKSYPFAKETKEFNNIIAFVGGRGTGKTSCMVSFAKYLIGDNKKNIKFEYNDIEAKENNIKSILDTKFISLPTIDPSLFEEDENIIEVVLAQMFSDFETILKNSQREVEQDTRRKLLERFDVVYRNLQTIIKGRKNYDGESLETLSKLAQSTNLRDNFKKLVHEFTGLKANAENDRGRYNDIFLIIPIDDFDLNVKAAAEMSEQIRKYFMIPNVIILMAVNIEQLMDAKEMSIRDDFKDMWEFLREDPAQMAVEYLLKLIPDNRRYRMPEIRYHLDSMMVNITRKNNSKENNTKEQDKKKYIGINEYLFSEIYNKTGLIFIPKNRGKHILIPNTHRRLKEIVFFLEKKLLKGDDNKVYNLRMLETYLLDIYLPSIISKEYYKYFDKIVSSDLMLLNWTVVNTMHSIISDYALKYNENLFSLDKPIYPIESSSYSNKEAYRTELEELLSRTNNPNNISLGDVLFLVNQTAKFFNDIEIDKLCDAVKVFYSIELLKLENSRKIIELKTIIGNSFLPSEYLMPIVSYKNYDIDLSPKPRFSRITYNYNNRGANNELYKYFAFYKGGNPHTRRKSIRNFYDGYNFESSNNFILDIFSCLVNTYYLHYESNCNDMKDKLNKSNLDKLKIINSTINCKHEKADCCNNCDQIYCLLPLHSIDIIENVLYNSFKTSGENLHNEIENIFLEIIKRMKNVSDFSNDIKNDIETRINSSYLINNVLELEKDDKGFFKSNKNENINKFRSFVNELEISNINNYVEKQFSKIVSEFVRFAKIVDNPNATKKLSTFYKEESVYFDEYKKLFRHNKFILDIINIIDDEFKINPDQRLKTFINNNNDRLKYDINSLLEIVK
jgi:hypothetical protein